MREGFSVDSLIDGVPDQPLNGIAMKAVYAVCAFGLGFVIGGVVFLAVDRSVDGRAVQPGIKSSSRSTEGSASGSNVDLAGDWYLGILDDWYRGIGPGSRFNGFITRLAEMEIYCAGDTRWAVTGPAVQAHLQLFVPGLPGKVLMEGIIPLRREYEGSMWLTLLWKPGELAHLDVDQTRVNRNQRVWDLGKAMGMSSEELRRVNVVLRLVPVIPSFPTESLERRVGEALLEFSDELPPRVKRRFASCLHALAEEDRSGVPGKNLDSRCPGVGFPLSDRYVMQVLFAPVEPSLFDHDDRDFKYEQPGPWCSIVFHHPMLQDYTSAEASDTWPRLTEEEMDDFVSRLARKD